MRTDKKSSSRNNYIWLLWVAAGAVLETVLLIINVFLMYPKGFQYDGNSGSYDGYYVMIVEDRKSDFWRSVYDSAYEAGLEQNVCVDLFGDNLSYNYSSKELMQIATYSDVDGIIVEADESRQMSELINNAVNAGIPVVTISGDSANSKRCSYVGVSNYDIGREYGRQVLKIGNERRRSQDVLVLMDVNSADRRQNIIYSGIQETILQENNSSVIDYNFSMVALDDSSTFAVEESIRNLFLKEEVPDIIICLNELHTACVYQAVVDHNRVGQVRILGNYSSDTILRGIYRNVIDATITVDTEQMGRYCVDALVEYEKFGNTSDYFAVDTTLIDAYNISDFRGGDEDE